MVAEEALAVNLRFNRYQCKANRAIFLASSGAIRHLCTTIMMERPAWRMKNVCRNTGRVILY